VDCEKVALEIYLSRSDSANLANPCASQLQKLEDIGNALTLPLVFVRFAQGRDEREELDSRHQS
jgi:hypothetical protein